MQSLNTYYLVTVIQLYNDIGISTQKKMTDFTYSIDNLNLFGPFLYKKCLDV